MILTLKHVVVVQLDDKLSDQVDKLIDLLENVNSGVNTTALEDATAKNEAATSQLDDAVKANT